MNAQYKCRMIDINGAKYLLVPKNIREYEDITDTDILMVTLEKLNKEN